MKRISRTLIVGLAVLILTAMAAATTVSSPANARDAVIGDLPATGDAFVNGRPRTRSSELTMKIDVAVLPSRLIIVDDSERIIEVYSNTGMMDYGSYALRVREQGLSGPELALTDNIRAQYERLMTELNWRMTGRVYP